MYYSVVENYYVLNEVCKEDLLQYGFVFSQTSQRWGIIKSKESKALIKQIFPKAKLTKEKIPITNVLTWNDIERIQYDAV